MLSRSGDGGGGGLDLMRQQHKIICHMNTILLTYLTNTASYLQTVSFVTGRMLTTRLFYFVFSTVHSLLF